MVHLECVSIQPILLVYSLFLLFVRRKNRKEKKKKMRFPLCQRFSLKLFTGEFNSGADELRAEDLPYMIHVHAYIYGVLVYGPPPPFFPPSSSTCFLCSAHFFFPLIFPEYRESLVSSFMTDIKLLFPPYIHTPLPCGRPSLTASGREFSFSSSMIAKKKKKEKKNMAKIMNVGLFAIDRDTIPCLRKALLVQLKVALHTPPFWLCSATSV